jgi:hypothetical protein
MLPTSIVLGYSKKLTKWGPVMIPDTKLHVLSWVSVGKIESNWLHALDHMEKKKSKTYESRFS